MNGRRWIQLALAAALVDATVAYAQQYPLIDRVAGEVVQKYQSTTCEQLWQKKGQPKSEREQELMRLLREDPQARIHFIDKIAAPIANKMFDCGMIP
jgi:hypothetical protein